MKLQCKNKLYDAPQTGKPVICGFLGEQWEWEVRQVFAGNREEPPEYILVCPECGAEESFGYADPDGSEVDAAEYILADR